MKLWSITAAAMAALLFATEAGATADTPGAPRASVRVLSGSDADLKWFGKGDLLTASSLCVTSTTGRFRLQVMFAGGVSPVTMPKFKIHFTTTAGDDATLVSNGGAALSFDGRIVGDANDATCAGAPNAKIQIAFAESDLTASLAGQYLGRLQLSVSPD